MDYPLSELVTYLSKYDSIDLLANIVSLQLMPENLDRMKAPGDIQDLCR